MKPDPALALGLSREIRPKLAGHPPEIQGGALADLVALYIAGHHPAIREEVLALWIEMVRQLIEPSEQQIAESRGGFPPEWRKQ